MGNCNRRSNHKMPKNTSIDERVFKKDSVYMGKGKVVSFGS